MAITKWLVRAGSSSPIQKECVKETAHFYIYLSGRIGAARRDAKGSQYCRYFDSELEALEFIRRRDELMVDQNRIARINRCGVDLLASLEECLPCLGWENDSDEDVRREHELGNGYAELILRARAIIAKAKGLV